MRSFPRRVDANQPAIVAALRKVGARVLPIHTLGHGAPDILVGHRGVLRMFELKDGDRPPSEQRLTPDEERFHREWREYVQIVRNVNEAMWILGLGVKR